MRGESVRAGCGTCSTCWTTVVESHAGGCASGAAGRLAEICGVGDPDVASPWITGTPTARTRHAGTATSANRRNANRDGSAKWASGSRLATATTRSRTESGATGFAARSSRTTGVVRSKLDIAHHLLQLLQGAAQPGRARGRADPEQARRVLAVEIKDHAQSDHLAFGSGKRQQSVLELLGKS